MRYKVRIINGVLNYVLAAFLIAAPLVLRNEENTSNFIMILAGIGSLTIGLVSNHELGIIKSVRYKDNLIANILLGIFILLSPFFFDFSELIFREHLIFGLLQIVLPFLSYKLHFAKKRQGLRPQLQSS